MRWTHIMVHHSLTQDTGTVSWPAIRKYHMGVEGWKDIGYNWGVELAGSEYEALVGRATDEAGAHCYQDAMNEKALSVCLIGNFDVSPPPQEQLAVAVQRVILPAMRIHGIPKENILFHREFAHYKSCPGTAFSKAMLLALIP